MFFWSVWWNQAAGSTNPEQNAQQTNNKRKRNSQTDIDQAAKKGRPKIRAEFEVIYKRTRNLASQLARYSTLSTIYNRYINYNEQITPKGLRVNNLYPFYEDILTNIYYILMYWYSFLMPAILLSGMRRNERECVQIINNNICIKMLLLCKWQNKLLIHIINYSFSTQSLRVLQDIMCHC